MDQGTHRMNGQKTPESLEREVNGIRAGLDAILAELDRRRHELTDWRLQVRRHPFKAALLGGGVLAVVGGTIALAVLRHRRRHRPREKARRLWKALSRMLDDPDAVARPSPSAEQELLAAAGSPVVAALAKRLLRRLAT